MRAASYACAMPILHPALPFAQWTRPAAQRLPGIMPLDRADWLLIDDAYGLQMRERARLLRARPDDVLAQPPQAEEAARELLDEVLSDLPTLGFQRDGDTLIRPDGLHVTPDPARPLWTLGHLLQEDFCILQKPEGAQEHVLSAAVLCFPASWTLAEKLGRALMRVHAPVAEYDARLGARVQRLFDAIRPEQPLMRTNILRYADPALFQPRREGDAKRPHAKGTFLRSERQCLLRLPRSRAVVFSIHTAVVHQSALTLAQRAALDTIMPSAQA